MVDLNDAFVSSYLQLPTSSQRADILQQIQMYQAAKQQQAYSQESVIAAGAPNPMNVAAWGEYINQRIAVGLPVGSSSSGEAQYAKSSTLNGLPAPYISKPTEQVTSSLPAPYRSAPTTPVQTQQQAVDVSGLALPYRSVAQPQAARTVDVAGVSLPAPFVSPTPQVTTSLQEITQQAAQQRAGYYGLASEGLTAQQTIGDTKTLAYERNLAAMATSLEMAGMPVPTALQTEYGRTGLALEYQRQQATPRGSEVSTRESQYYIGEMQKWAQRPIEQSAEYHYIGKSLGVPVPANPFEYQADLGVELMKGLPTKSSAFFSPVSGELFGVLPGGAGLQDVAWYTAKTGEVPRVSFMGAVGKVAAAEGQYGPYGTLYGGPSYIGTPSSEGLRKQAEFIWTPALEKSAFAAVSAGAPVKSGVTKTVTRDRWLSAGPDVTVSGVDISKLPSPYISETRNIVKPTGELSFTIPFTETTLRATPPGALAGLVAFFQPETKVTTKYLPATYTPEVTTLKETRYYEVPGVGTTTEKIYETTGGAKRDIIITPTEIPKSSGFDVAGQTFLKTIRAPSVAVGEKGLEISELYNPFSQQSIGMRAGREIAFAGIGAFGVETKPAREQATAVAEATSLTKGQYQQFTEQPFLMPASFAIGGAFGLVAKGAEATYMAGRAGIAEKVISQGGAWRALEQTGATVVSRAPQVLGGLYAIDIGARAVEGAKTPTEAVTRARGLVVQEAAPMGVGFAAGYKAPGAISTAIGEAKIGLQQAKIELAAQKTSELRPALDYPERIGLSEQVIAKPVSKVISPEDITIRELAGYKIGETTAGAKQIARDIASGRTLEFAKLGAQQRVEETKAVTRAIPSAAESVYAQAYKTYFETKLEVPLKARAIFEQAPRYKEATRGYFEYPGIETKAYPKGTPVSKIVSDVAISARVKASDIGDVARYKVTRSWEYTPKPEIQRYPVSEQVAMAYQYDVIPGETVYGKTLGKLIAPSTFGETIPAAEIVAARRAKFEAGAPTATKPYAPSGAGRITTTTVGGKVRSRLAKEPSLKSMGISETATKATGIQIGRTTDYRGKPVSGTMKPMTESSYGYQWRQAAVTLPVMSEPLPGMDYPQAQRGAAPQQRGVALYPSVSEIERARQSRVVEVAPAFAFGEVQAFGVAQTQRQRQGTIQAQAQRQGLKQTYQQAQRQRATQDIERAFRQSTDMGQRQRTATDIIQGTSLYRGVSQRYDQSFTQGQITRQTQTTTTKQTTQTPPPIKIEIPGVPPLPTWGAGAAGGGGIRKRRGAFKETFAFGLDLAARGFRIPGSVSKRRTKSKRRR